MFFNNRNIQKLSLIAVFVFLLGCALKQPIVEKDPALEAQNLEAQKEQEQFKQALGLVQAENATENDLLKAKNILNALYGSNSAYIGALINSADISLKLKNLDQAKTLYLEALQKIEDQQVTGVSTGKTADKSTKPKQVVSENINIFMIHTYNQLGLIERQLGQFGQAEAYYRKALALDSNNAITIKNLAILLDLYRGELAEAFTLYKQYQDLVGDSDPKIKDWLYDLKNRLPVEEAADE
tara:strand:- start:690 stop:1409 length:720 start_codon:yes stop_codon:yes gene_type:complete